MENKSLTIHSVYIPEVEALVTKLKKDYEEFNNIEPKFLAERPGFLTPTEARVCIYDPMQAKAQHSMDEIAKWMQVRAQFYTTKDNEQSSADEHVKLGIQKQEMQRQLPALKQQKEASEFDDSKMKPWRLFNIIAPLAALADGATAYTPIRNVYSVLPSLLICGVIGGAIGTSHHAYVPWIKKAKGRLEKWAKISAILIIAGTFFYYIGSLRATAAGATISIDPQYQQHTVTAVSPLAIAVISLVLFVVVFALAMHFYVSKEDKEHITTSKKAAAALQTHESQIQAIELKQQKLKDDLLQQRARIRQLNDYYRAVIVNIKSIAESARKDFKRIYAQFKLEIPDFFAHDEPLQFNDHLNLFSEQSKTKK